MAEHPDGDFHCERGKRVALRVGCDAQAWSGCWLGRSIFGRFFSFDPAGSNRGSIGHIHGQAFLDTAAVIEVDHIPVRHVSRHGNKRSSSSTRCRQVHANSSRRCIMNAHSSVTETVVRNHLRAFLEQNGVDSIVQDYHDAALFYSEAKIYHGKHEIRGFFTSFIDTLPADGISQFELRSLQVEGNVAYITWSVGHEIPLGTDTFVVDRGKIVSQTFAMHAAPAP
jgi:ketosteroid isomerase-like protein